MDVTVSFLDLILPESGLRCGFVQQTKSNYFFNTNQELAAFLLRADAAGYTTYHACATYRSTESRKGENVAAVASLWSDVDAGPGKPYADANEAARCVANACQQANLASPLFVCSGRGIHCYWPLDSELEPGLWRRYAVGLRAVLRAAGLQFDPARACDVASILRTPGTTHRKEAVALPVLLAAEVGPYEIEQFAFLLEHADDQQETNHQSSFTPTRIEAPAYLQRGKPAHLLDRTSFSSPVVAACSAPIAERCGQVQRLRDWRVFKELPEPIWYAVLGVLAFAQDGDECAHAWSEGHTTYVPDQTQERLDRLRSKLTGATTCERFESLEPAICARCPHRGKIKSPISLGMGVVSSDQAPAVGAETGVPGSLPASSVASPTSNNTLPRLPPHFAWKGQSLVFQTEAGGNAVDHLISNYPIYLATPNRDEVQQDFSVTFNYWIPAIGWSQFTTPLSKLMGGQGIAELGRFGVNIAHDAGGHFIRYVKAALDQCYQELKLQTRYDQYGWKADDTAFLYGGKLYTSHGEFTVNGNEELTIRSKWLGAGVSAQGTRDPERYGLAQWTASANALFAAGCEAQSIALLASFAATLMRFLSTDEGGAIISLVTKESGTGKSTALAGAFSVWGAKQGLSITADDNNVTKWLTLGALGNLPLVHDEIATRDPEMLKDFVITFTNGRDKMRATRDGKIRHSASTWQTLLVTASNASLVDSLTTASQEDAPQYRVLELPLEVPPNLKFQMGDELKNALIANAGYAGEAFARYIVKPEVTAYIKHACATYRDTIWRRTGADQKQRFRVRAVAGIAVAGLIVNHLGLVSFSTDRIVEYLINYLTLTAKRRGEAFGPVNWDIEAVADFIMEENQNFLIVPTEWKRGTPRIRPSREPKGKMSGAYATFERRLWISVQALREYAVKHEHPFREWMNLLMKRGVMTQDVFRRSLTSGTDIPGAMINVVELNMGHVELHGADHAIGMAPSDDTTNVTPMRRH